MTEEDIMTEKVKKTILADKLKGICPSLLLMSDKELENTAVALLIEADTRSKFFRDIFLKEGFLEIELNHERMPDLLSILGASIMFINNRERERGVSLSLEKVKDDYKKMNLIYKKE